MKERIAPVALVLIAIACFAGSLKISGPKLSGDSMDYAQSARQVAAGRGFTSKLMIGELTDGVTRDGNLAGPWTNTIRTPLPVYAIAATFRVFGVSDYAVTYWAGAFYVATCWLMLRTFAPLFGFEIAFLSALLFAFSKCGITYARAGLTESAAMFFLVLVFRLMQGKLNPLRCAVIGIVFGVASLNRPIALVWAVAAMLFIWFYESGAMRRVIALALGVAGVALLARIAGWHEGHAAFAIGLSIGVGGARQAFREPVAFVLTHFSLFIRKIIWQLGRPFVYLFQLGDLPVISGLIPFGLLFCRDEDQRRNRAFLLILFASNAVALSVILEGDAFVGPLRYFDVFVPLGLAWGVQLLLHLCRDLAKPLKVAFWCLVVILFAGSAFQAIRDPFPIHADPELYSYIRKTIPDGEVIAASPAAEPTAIAWYADRRTVSVALPDSAAALAEFRQQGLRVSWFVTGLDDQQPPHGFEVRQTLANGITVWQNSGGANE